MTRWYVLGCANSYGLVFLKVVSRIFNGHPYPFYPRVPSPRLGIQPLFGDEPMFSPQKTAGHVRLSFVQIDQSGIRLPRLSRKNNYINYLCLQFRIHFTFFTWYLLRTFSGMFCVTDIAFYVLQKLAYFLAKQNHDLLQSAREYS